MDSFHEILKSHETWLRERILSYARDVAICAHPSRDDETCGSSVADVSAFLEHVVSAPVPSPAPAHDAPEDCIIRAARALSHHGRVSEHRNQSAQILSSKISRTL